jgi:hypothetical protein
MASQSPLTDGQMVEKILNEYASIPYAHGNFRGETIFDRERGRYLLIAIGWDGDLRVHHTIVDIEIRHNKFYIHRDNLEEGVVTDLEQYGVPKERIVLAWMDDHSRRSSEYAFS